MLLIYTLRRSGNFVRLRQLTAVLKSSHDLIGLGKHCVSQR